MMKLGFVSAILPEMPLEELVSFASQERFSTLELMCWPTGKAERRYAGVTHLDVADLTDERVEEVKKLCGSKQIEISALGYYPNPLDADLEQREVYISHLKKVIEAAQRLGLETVNTFIGRLQQAGLEENFREFEKVWNPIVRFAEDKGIKIGIENCPMYFTTDEWPSGKNLAYSPAVWERMFEIIPSPNLGLNYDPSHLLWQHIDYIKPIYDFKDRLFHVHIKDAKLHRDKLARVGIMATPLEFHSPKLPGLGDINWGAFFSALTDVRYKGALSIEVEDRAYEDSLESRKSAIRQSRNYVSVYL
ncbi:MAG: sugar phosphate isomerase/epimerase [Cohnella sp.]|nr:sugar phosphate isomerase/epimerase [Cohnella sp.]